MNTNSTLMLGVALVAIGLLFYSVLRYFLGIRRTNDYGTVVVKGYFDWLRLSIMAGIGGMVASLTTIVGLCLIGLHLIGWDIVGETLQQSAASQRPNFYEIAPRAITSGATHFSISTNAENPAVVFFGEIGQSNTQTSHRVNIPFGTCITADPVDSRTLNVTAAPGVVPPAWTMANQFSEVDATMRCSEDGQVVIFAPSLDSTAWSATHRVNAQNLELRSGPLSQFPVTNRLEMGECVAIVQIETPSWIMVTYRDGRQIGYGFMSDIMNRFSAVEDGNEC